MVSAEKNAAANKNVLTLDFNTCADRQHCVGALREILAMAGASDIKLDGEALAANNKIFYLDLNRFNAKTRKMLEQADPLNTCAGWSRPEAVIAALTRVPYAVAEVPESDEWLRSWFKGKVVRHMGIAEGEVWVYQASHSGTTLHAVEIEHRDGKKKSYSEWLYQDLKNDKFPRVAIFNADGKRMDLPPAEGPNSKPSYSFSPMDFFESWENKHGRELPAVYELRSRTLPAYRKLGTIPKGAQEGGQAFTAWDAAREFQAPVTPKTLSRELKIPFDIVETHFGKEPKPREDVDTTLCDLFAKAKAEADKRSGNH